MFNFIKNLRSPEKKFGTGLVPDTRPDEEKDKDFTADEIGLLRATSWSEKPKEQWKRFEPVFNQFQSSSCVSQSIALSLGIENHLEEGKFVPLSARFIYAQGYESGGGMYYAKALDIAKKQGCPPEQLMPSQNLGEDKMTVFDAKESDKQVALVYKPANYVYLPIDFDLIAGIVDRGKPVVLGTRFNSGGFSQLEVQLSHNGVYGHAVVCVDRTLWNNKRALVFQNSWGSSYGFGGLGIITEDQILGLTTAAYFEELVNNWRDNPPVDKPKYFFANNLSFGQVNNEITKLQEILRYEGFFPTIAIKTPAYYGNITAKAVLGFQKKYKVDSDEELNALRGRKVGPKTKEALNQIYG